jgi:hypothetical protein
MSYRYFFVTASVHGLYKQSEEYSSWISHSVPSSELSGSLSIIFWSLFNSISNIKVSEDCGSRVIIVEEADGVGDKGPGDNIVVNLEPFLRPCD